MILFYFALCVSKILGGGCRYDLRCDLDVLDEQWWNVNSQFDSPLQAAEGRAGVEGHELDRDKDEDDGDEELRGKVGEVCTTCLVLDLSSCVAVVLILYRVIFFKFAP